MNVATFLYQLPCSSSNIYLLSVLYGTLALTLIPNSLTRFLTVAHVCNASHFIKLDAKLCLHHQFILARGVR